MTEKERREAERLYREWRDKYDASFIGRWSEHKVPLNPDIFAAGRDSMRAECDLMTHAAELNESNYHDALEEWRSDLEAQRVRTDKLRLELEAERARSIELLKVLMDALPAVITLESQNGRRLWMMSDRIKKAIDEYEAARG